MKILVTGGTGMVGRYLRKLSRSHEWIFISSKWKNEKSFKKRQKSYLNTIKYEAYS